MIGPWTNATEFKELVKLAEARYPNTRVDMAVAMLESDRRAAGLGALEGRAICPIGVSNSKEAMLLDGRIVYHTAVRRPAKQWGDWDGLRLPSSPGDMASAFVTIRHSKPVGVLLAMQVNKHEFTDQAGRDGVARALRRMRAERFARVAAA